MSSCTDTWPSLLPKESMALKYTRRVSLSTVTPMRLHGTGVRVSVERYGDGRRGGGEEREVHDSVGDGGRMVRLQGRICEAAMPATPGLGHAQRSWGRDTIQQRKMTSLWCGRRWGRTRAQGCTCDVDGREWLTSLPPQSRQRSHQQRRRRQRRRCRTAAWPGLRR